MTAPIYQTKVSEDGRHYQMTKNGEAFITVRSPDAAQTKRAFRHMLEEANGSTAKDLREMMLEASRDHMITAAKSTLGWSGRQSLTFSKDGFSVSISYQQGTPGTAKKEAA